MKLINNLIQYFNNIDLINFITEISKVIKRFLIYNFWNVNFFQRISFKLISEFYIYINRLS